MAKKIFTKAALTNVQLRALMCSSAKSFGVNRLIFNRNAKHVRGTYNPHNRNMYLSLKQTKKDVLITFFHELGHHQATLQNKWKSYHLSTIKQMKIETIFKIENSIDKIGCSLWNKYVDQKQWGKYKYAYPKSQKTQIMNQIAAS
jgi:hypothetical protein